MTGAMGLHAPSWTFERGVIPALLQPDNLAALAERLSMGDGATFYDAAAPAAGLLQVRLRRGRYVIADEFGTTIGLFGQLVDALRFVMDRTDERAARCAEIEAWLDGDAPCPWYNPN